MLHKLVFDTTDSDTMLDSANVGAYLRAGADGALIGHQTIAASEWLQVVSATADGAGNLITSTGGALDVNLKSPISVSTDLNGVYDVSTNPTPDNVGLIVNSRAASPDDTTQLQRLTAGTATADAVVAANVHGLDTNSFGMLYNGTTWDRWKSTGAAGSADVNITNSLTVSDTALANTAIVGGTTTLTVAATAVAAVASPLASRKYLTIYNNDNKVMYIGGASVDATGFPIPPGSLLEMRAGAAVPVTLYSTKAAHDSRHLELS